MVFYIAEKNKETGKFELWNSDDKLHEINSESAALNTYENVVKLQGIKKVILLEEVVVDVELSVKRWNPEND